MPAILGSLSACNKAVTAPIDLPHKAIVLTLRSYLKWSIIYATSSLSNHPSEMYSPSEFPQPAKSKQKSVIFYGKR